MNADLLYGLPVSRTGLPLRVEATFDVAKRCPVNGDMDHGSVTIAWAPDTDTVELGSLRKYLGAFAGVRMSHEDFVVKVKADIDSVLGGGSGVMVVATWRAEGAVTKVTC